MPRVDLRSGGRAMVRGSGEVTVGVASSRYQDDSMRKALAEKTPTEKIKYEFHLCVDWKVYHFWRVFGTKVTHRGGGSDDGTGSSCGGAEHEPAP